MKNTEKVSRVVTVSPSITIRGHEMELAGGRLRRERLFFFLSRGYNIERVRVKGRLDKLMEKSIRGCCLQKRFWWNPVVGRRKALWTLHLHASVSFCHGSLLAVDYWCRWTFGLMCLIFKVPETLQAYYRGAKPQVQNHFFFFQLVFVNGTLLAIFSFGFIMPKRHVNHFVLYAWFLCQSEELNDCHWNRRGWVLRAQDI